MQRRTPRASTVAAAVGGFSAGVAITTTAEDGLHFNGVSVSDVCAVLLPMVCVTAFAMTTIRRWMAQQEEHTLAALTGLFCERQRQEQELDNRAFELASREAQLNWQTEMNQRRVASLAERLDETLNDLGEERRRRAQLEEEYDELANDHNRVILETLQERADRFASRAWGTLATSPRSSGRGQPYGSPRILKRMPGTPADDIPRDHNHPA